MSKRPTIIDVARHAGVSKSTVSLVLQHSPLVKNSTKKRIEQSFKALNYVYNRRAANLRKPSAGLIGLIINDLRNPFFTEFATSAQMTLSANGFATIIANTNEDPGIQGQVISSMIEHGVAAVIISPTYGSDAKVYEPFQQAQIPLMQVLRRIEDSTVHYPFFSFDYLTGGRLAARHMLNIRQTNVAFVGGIADFPITLERMAGFKEVMGGQGQSPLSFQGRPTRAFGRETAFLIARDFPEIRGAMCFNDLVALGMLSAFEQMGIKVGTDFSLIGFDDVEECELVYPQLSSIRCDISKFGCKSAGIILDWISTGECAIDAELLPVELVIRQSSIGAGPDVSP